MRHVKTIILLVCLGFFALASYAIEVPEELKNLNLHAIQAPPDADASLTSITQLPLQPLGENNFLLPDGRYLGNFVIDVPIHLTCAEGAVFDAQGQKNAINIRANNAVLENCRLENWGTNLTDMNSGIFIERYANHSVVKNNSLYGPGFGVWADAAQNLKILDNKIQGYEQMRTQDRGNGIHIFAVRFALVKGNELWHVRDGIYSDAANDNRIEDNYLHDMRYGIHYMFSNRNEVINNYTKRTRTGYALMQSRQLTVLNNTSVNDQNYGILMNYITYSTIKNNLVYEVEAGVGDGIHITGGEGKAVFVYNSLFNTLAKNVFAGSALGIHLTAGSEDNKIYSNTFIGNQKQVKYVSNRSQEWSLDGRGNFWSDYLGWDRNNDGLGDIAYEPNDNVDKLLWTYPQARLLMNSPSIEALRLIQKVFPVIKAQGVQDSYPLMQPQVKLPQNIKEVQ